MADKDGRGTLADKHILHMLTPLKHMSPFDVNMAVDAGFDAVIPYTAVTLEEIQGLVQDAIFSRPPKGGVNTAVFIGGKNAGLALDMLAAARKALVPPFGISFFADPAGSFTTAAAMIACVEKTLRGKKKRNLKGTSIVVFGATGVVGYSAAVLAALEGAEVTLVGHDGIRRVAAAGADIKARFDVEVAAADGSDEERKTALLAGAEVALCAGRAGVEILSRPALDAAKKTPGRRRRQCGAAGGCRRSRHGGGRRRTQLRGGARDRSPDHRQRQVQDRIRHVREDHRGQEAGQFRLSRRLRARPRNQWIGIRRC